MFQLAVVIFCCDHVFRASVTKQFAFQILNDHSLDYFTMLMTFSLLKFIDLIFIFRLLGTKYQIKSNIMSFKNNYTKYLFVLIWFQMIQCLTSLLGTLLFKFCLQLKSLCGSLMYTYTFSNWKYTKGCSELHTPMYTPQLSSLYSWTTNHNFGGQEAANLKIFHFI
jgi:hypothetical protein